jgi:hypothetical protein
MRFPSIHSLFSRVRVDRSDVSLKLQILERLMLFVELHGSGFASVIISCFANIEEIVVQGCVLSPPAICPSDLGFRTSSSRQLLALTNGGIYDTMLPACLGYADNRKKAGKEAAYVKEVQVL